jgi:hypothetical protein
MAAILCLAKKVFFSAKNYTFSANVFGKADLGKEVLAKKSEFWNTARNICRMLHKHFSLNSALRLKFT